MANPKPGGFNPAHMAKRVPQGAERRRSIAEQYATAPVLQTVGRLLVLAPEEDSRLREPFHTADVRVLTWKPRLSYVSAAAFQAAQRLHDTTAEELVSSALETLSKLPEMSGLQQAITLDVDSPHLARVNTRGGLYDAECRASGSLNVGLERLFMRRFLQPNVQSKQGPLQLEFGEIILEHAGVSHDSTKLAFADAVQEVLGGQATLAGVELIDLPTSH